MKISKDTLRYGSFSANPGNSGCKRFNNAFQKNNINAIYQSFGVENISDAFEAAHTLGFCGFAVSMPFKYEAALICTEIDPLSHKLRSVNCVKVVGDKAIGYNTDYVGIKEYLNSIDSGHSRATIIGTGAFARTALYVLTEAGKMCRYLPRQAFEENPSILGKISGEIIFNATPAHHLKSYVNPDCYYIDSDPESPSGKKMSFFSARAQFFDVYGFDRGMVFEEVA